MKPNILKIIPVSLDLKPKIQNWLFKVITITLIDKK